MICSNCKVAYFNTVEEVYSHLCSYDGCAHFYQALYYENTDLRFYGSIQNAKPCGSCHKLIFANEGHICSTSSSLDVGIGTVPFFKCIVCSEIFRSAHEHNNHLHECYGTFHQLTEYVQQFHPNVNIFQSSTCWNCGKSNIYTQVELDEHSETCSFRCRYCLVMYSNYDTFTNHRIQPVSCQQCNIWFCNVELYQVHAQIICNRCNRHFSNDMELFAHAQQSYKCLQCSLEFCSSDLLFAHQATCLLCPYCGVLCANQFELHSHRLYPVICETCNMSFCNASICDEHYWTCLNCNMKCCNEQMFQAHSAACHRCMCGRIFADASALHEHVVYMPNCTLVCRHCNINFNTIEAINAHYQNSVRCQKCAWIFCSIDQLNAHMETCLKCVYCKNNFPTIDNFQSHKQMPCNICHQNYCNSLEMNDHKSIAIRCYKCKDEFCEKSQFDGHQCLCVLFDLCLHCKLADIAGTEMDHHKSICRYIPTPTYIDMYQCCGIQFKNQFYFMEHTLEVHGTVFITCTICRASFQPKAYESHVFKQHNTVTPFKCPLCIQHFRLMEEYKWHYNEYHHTPLPGPWVIVLGYILDKYFTCTRCRRTFPDKSKYVEHLISSHQVTNILCHFCFTVFNTQTYRTHARGHGNEIRPYQCVSCKMYFISKRTYEIHNCAPPRLLR